MGNAVDKIRKAIASKNAIKEATQAKGGNISDTTPFSQYGTAISELSGGVDQILIDLIEGNQVNLVIPEGITKIAKFAFWQDRYIKSIEIPSTIVEIGENAFSNIDGSLNTVVIKEGITYLAKNMFAACTKLNSINIPKTVTKLDYGVFNNCSSLTYLVVPSTVTTYGSYCLNIGSSTNQATIRFEHEIPPTVPNSAMTLAQIKEIQVPINSVEAYKAKTTFANYAEKIVGYEV